MTPTRAPTKDPGENNYAIDPRVRARVLKPMTATRPEPAIRKRTARFVVVTGLSGAGKSAAIRALEDLGYLCVDNLPTVLIPTLADLTLGEGATYDSVAVVVDARDRSFLDQFAGIFKSLRARRDLGTWLIFLEASDAALLRRFSETRRPHPLAPTGSVIEGILAERARLRRIKKMADKVLDTSDLTVHELRRAFRELSQGDDKQTRLTVTLLSFGYKHGVPGESDLLFDVRFLPNPHLVPGLRQLTGKNQAVRDYVAAAAATTPFLDKTTDLLRFLIPQYTTEGKSYLTIGIGCTGGHHRSVAIVEQLKTRLAGVPGVRWRVKHRDIAVE